VLVEVVHVPGAGARFDLLVGQPLDLDVLVEGDLAAGAVVPGAGQDLLLLALPSFREKSTATIRPRASCTPTADDVNNDNGSRSSDSRTDALWGLLEPDAVKVARPVVCPVAGYVEDAADRS
jgi:hypothetical protein